MTSTEDNRFFFSAWGLSLALHGIVVVLAFAFVVQVNPALQKELFQSTITLVEDATLDSKSEPVKSALAPEQPPTKKALPSQTKRVAEISKTVGPIDQKILPPQRPIETVQPIEQRMVEVAETNAVQAAELKDSVAGAALPELGESQTVQQEPVVSPSSPSPDVSVSHEAPAQASLQESGMDDAASVQVAKAAAPGPEPKADNRWVGESLWRRVGELKRYPNLARMNGQEGKVILKAVIRSDGHLADVSVQKSSGHSVLDAAAIEAVKLACPLHMKHAIGKPQIVVSLPIVYSLAN